jgi:hypothetical protein
VQEMRKQGGINKVKIKDFNKQDSMLLNWGDMELQYSF